jgi:hypothetical protein
MRGVLLPASGAAWSSSFRAQEEDPTSRDVWDQEPSYSSHYASDEQRPNICKVTHVVPALLGSGNYSFDEDRGYVPFIATSVVRDSQMMLMRLYHR